MRLIVAGSRNATEADVREAIRRCRWVDLTTCLVSGTARGADSYGERWATEKGIPIQQFPADWKRYGRGAGPRRNKVMAQNADGLIAVWDGKSRGTESMIELAVSFGLRVCIYRTDLREVLDHPAQGEILDRWDEAEERAAIQGTDAPRESVISSVPSPA